MPATSEPIEVSYCVVNTDGAEHLRRCLAAIGTTHPEGLSAEVLVCDNASADNSVAVAEGWASGAGRLGPTLRLFALERRAGKAANDSLLLAEARGELCLLLNEDSELRPGATATLIETLRAYPQAAVAGAQLLGPDGSRSACAWRLPGVGTALAQALFVHRGLVTQSADSGPARRVGWVQSAAMLVRRSAAQEVGYLDPKFFVYSDETDFCKRLGDQGWWTMHVPGALAVHHEQLTNDRSQGTRRMVEFHRNRDLYMRKHHGRAAAALVRALTAWSYGLRAAAALVLPGHDAGLYTEHARLALHPAGEGIREAAAAHNRRLDEADRG